MSKGEPSSPTVVAVDALASATALDDPETGPDGAAGEAAAGTAFAVPDETEEAPAASALADDAEPSTSSDSTTEPSPTLSPSLTFKAFTTPAWLEGISMEALSDSTVMRLCSTLMVSPGLTSTSITATSLKSPMSGILMSMVAITRPSQWGTEPDRWSRSVPPFITTSSDGSRRGSGPDRH
jgi:hypothetical protein